MPPTDPISVTNPTPLYRLTPGPHTRLTACPHDLTRWVEDVTCLLPAEAVALATEAMLRGWGEVGRLRLERIQLDR